MSAGADGRSRHPDAGALTRARALLTSFRDDIRRDLDGGRGLLWWPVALGTGQAIYFVWPSEPPASAVVAAVLLAAAIAIGVGRKGGAFGFPVTLGFLVLLGFGVAKAAVVAWDAPRLSTERTYVLSGVVGAAEDRGARGVRLILRPIVMDPPPREGLPERVRVSVRRLAEVPIPGRV